VEILARHLGDWQGSNAFRLTPDDPPYEAAATAQVSARVRGLVTEVTYTWVHEETGEHAGLLVLAEGDEPPAVRALWSDTFHQNPAAASLTGTALDGTVTLGLTYGGDWEWTIVVDATDPDRLTIRMDNTVPPSAAELGYPVGTYWAMNADLRRVAG
jgi:hypothetical protein